MAFATEGSGPYGLSFEASLNDWPAALATRRPGLYVANWSSTERNRGDRSDTVVLRLGFGCVTSSVPPLLRTPAARMPCDRTPLIRLPRLSPLPQRRHSLVPVATTTTFGPGGVRPAGQLDASESRTVRKVSSMSAVNRTKRA